MTEEGLQLNEEEFKSLKIKDQLTLLYRNEVEILKLVKAYRLHQKVQYGAILILFAAVSILINAHIP